MIDRVSLLKEVNLLGFDVSGEDIIIHNFDKFFDVDKV